VVVSFHSLEDRLVKLYLADRANRHRGSRHLPVQDQAPAGYTDVGKMVTASDTEVAANPRARSAKLRSATRSDAAPRAEDFGIFKLPNLPWIDARSVATQTSHTGAP
ncbi:MAG: 16S rRNA (cytosine(1402)-N(4))-methyltransferase, partial [Pseudomonadota bacterium]